MNIFKSITSPAKNVFCVQTIEKLSFQITSLWDKSYEEASVFHYVREIFTVLTINGYGGAYNAFLIKVAE